MKTLPIALIAASFFPLNVFASGADLVTAFETYCMKNTDNMLILDRGVSVTKDRHVADLDVLNNKGDIGYFISSGGRQYLVEWGNNACRVSAKSTLPDDVMKALASKHILTVPHGDQTNFGRAHWFEEGHGLTRYAFTHDLNDSTIVFEYQTNDAIRQGPVALTLTR